LRSALVNAGVTQSPLVVEGWFWKKRSIAYNAPVEFGAFDLFCISLCQAFSRIFREKLYLTLVEVFAIDIQARTMHVFMVVILINSVDILRHFNPPVFSVHGQP
jgi:hypothetical protein